MRFLDLYISGYGKFHNMSVSFEDGINVVYGKNEAGKSTIHTFIRSMLFGLERQRGRAARNDIYSRYEPWDSSGTYEGQLRLEADGMVYRIERSFQKNRKEFTIINETTGREETGGKAFMDELLGGLSEMAYNNTISISQLKSATEDGMISELKNYIANMNTSGNMSLNITKASDYLKKQKKELQAQLSPEAARTYTMLLTEIRGIEKEIASPEYENQMLQYTALREELKQAIDEKQREKNELAAKLDRGWQMMEEFEFSDDASIQSYLNNAEALYRNYTESEEIAKNRSGRILPGLFFTAAALLCAVFGVCLYAWYYPDRLPLFSSLYFAGAPAAAILSGLAGAASLAAGLFSMFRRRRHDKEARLCHAALSEIFRRHLGDSAVSDPAMEALRVRIAEFNQLYQNMSHSRETLKQQTEAISSLLERQNACGETIERQQRVQWELEKKLEHLSDCKDRAAALKQIISENDRLHVDIEAIDLALETMQDLSFSIRDSFGLYLNKTASDLISGITGGVYASISIDENLNAFLNTSRKLIPLEQTSSGTADQIYLALRLAAARFIQRGIDRMPLIFDDSFVLYDNDRLKTALRWLPQAYKGQMILFTCHEREEQALREMDMPFHLIRI